MSSIRSLSQGSYGANDEKALFRAMAKLETPKEVEAFMRDLATPGEVAAFAERWQIAIKLDRGDTSYRKIAEETGASTTTIGRVARFLRDEKYGGYRLLLERMTSGKRK